MGHVATYYNVFLLPSTVFIHPSGTVVAVHLGAMTPAQIEILVGHSAPARVGSPQAQR